MWLPQNLNFSRPFFTIPFFIFCSLILTVLNIVSLIYANVDLFTIDIAQVKKENKRLMEKLEFVIKKSHSISSSICLFQTIATLLISRANFFESSANWKIYFFAIAQMTFLELIPNYLVRYFNSRPKYLLNVFFLNSAYVIAKLSPFTFLLRISDEKKIFSHGEEDIIRFVNNLTSKEILLLEPKEAQLVNLAFRLDDRDIKNIYIPNEQVIYLKTSMEKQEIKEAWAKKSLTKYPVLDKNGDFIGILNTRSFVSEAINSNNLDLGEIDFWEKHVNKDNGFINTNTKLSEALETLKNSENHFSVVKENEKIVGIITLNDVLSSLVGKISDES